MCRNFASSMYTTRGYQICMVSAGGTAAPPMGLSSSDIYSKACTMWQTFRGVETPPQGCRHDLAQL